MDTTVTPPNTFGSAEAKFGPQQRLGSVKSLLSQLQDVRWKGVADHDKQASAERGWRAGIIRRMFTFQLTSFAAFRGSACALKAARRCAS